MPMQKSIRHLTNLELVLRDYGRRGEKQREHLRKALETAPDHAKPPLKLSIDFLDASLNHALSLQEDLSQEAREKIYSLPKP